MILCLAITEHRATHTAAALRKARAQVPTDKSGAFGLTTQDDVRRLFEAASA